MTEQTLNQEPRKTLSLLASERFGHTYKGEVNEAPEPEESPAEVELEAPETEDLPIAAQATESETESGEIEGREYELSDVAMMLGVEESSLDVDDDGKIVLNKKVDGQTSKSKISDLLKTSQTWEAAEKRLEEAKAKAKSINQELTEKSERIQEQYAVAATLIQNIESALADDESEINWNRLKQEDPAEYSAKKIELQEKRAKVEKMKADAINKYNQNRETLSVQQEQAMRQQLVKEQEALLTKLPDWKNDDTAKAEKRMVSEYLLKEGFEQHDIASAIDHRLIIMARKAALYDQGQVKNDALSKKVKVIPKVLKPGSTKPAEQVGRERLEKLRIRMQQSGKESDALAYYKARKAS